jgi:hypothetical protein
MAAAAPQQINVADLELPQLAEVKRQLEEVCASFSPQTLTSIALNTHFSVLLGALAPDQFFRPTQAGPGKVPVLHRERKRGKTREQRYSSAHMSLPCGPG